MRRRAAGFRSAALAAALLPALSGAALPTEAARGAGDQETHGEHRVPLIAYLEVERLEIRSGEGSRRFLADFQSWFGGDLHKLWLKAEREPDGEVFEGQLLYSRAVSPFFDVQIGARRDFGAAGGSSYAVIGLEGLAPYLFEVDAAVFLRDDGGAFARLEAELDLLLTQRLILQPRGEIGLGFGKGTVSGRGAALGAAEAGIHLRYEIRREFAPYLGVLFERTRDPAGESVGAGADWSPLLVMGLRVWY